MSKSSGKAAGSTSKSPKSPHCSTASRNGVIMLKGKPTDTNPRNEERDIPKKINKTEETTMTQMSNGAITAQGFIQEESRARRRNDINNLSDVAPRLPALEAMSNKQNCQGSVQRDVEKLPQIPVTTSEKKKRSKMFKAMWDELEKEEFFHGLIPLEEVRSIVNENGDFLVRKLGDDIKSTPPILTVMWNATLYHLPLYGVQRGKNSPKFTLNTHDYSSTYGDLIRMHWMQKIPLFKGIILITRVPRQAWELTRDNVSIEEKIHEGAYGEVRRGKLKIEKDDMFGTTVAVKIMKVTPSTQAQLETLHKQARLMRVYNHRNLVKLYGLVFDDRDVMLIMELVRGGPLNLYLKNNKLMPLMKASFCYDIAAGLAYLHSKNCMHRDVAARNCLVESDGKMIKLSDFAMAVHGRRTMLSSTNRMPARWQAPEVLIHYVYLRESDVWSYGMLMSEIYNDGKPPFHDKTCAEIRSKKSAAASTQVPRSLESKSFSLELPPAMANEKEATKVQNNHLSPYLPSPNAVSHNKSAASGILVSQPSYMAFQLRNNQKPRRAKSLNKISK
ncbi:hypothetical protein Aduo_003881 [Ancylostoma duodenale]